MTSEKQSESFGQMRSLIDDLFTVRPGIYWVDFGLTSVLAWFCFWQAMQTPFSSGGMKTVWTLGAAFAFFRCLIFIHEMVHIRKPALSVFRIVWNVFCGMIFFLPDYVYDTHQAHHLTTTFSTQEDPEYVPVAFQKPFELLAPFFIFPFVPLLLGIRFLIVGPVSILIGGRLRNEVLRHASTLKMNPRFVWENITAAVRRSAFIGDVCTVLVWVALLMFFHRTVGWRVFLPQWYLVSYAMFTINHLRSLLRHRYTNVTRKKVSFEEQILDSVTITGFSPLATLFTPVGLRYHSLHHMFPSLPYHSMLQAHSRLIVSLPSDHLYHKTIVKGFWAAAWNFVVTVRANTSY